MGTLKKKATPDNKKINHEDSTAVNKKPEPIKAGSKHQGDTGGIFTSKVAAIMKKILGRPDGKILS